ncbi:hypothetical protein [Mycolicibacterium hippocampi]|uniref:Uncharacterized protein n=1 Tax=Mycolicibacterium hippocampi TaxID=659824 RepID=A0A7I9ZUU3_9MYCO|nr:hypothetical protein [Mycolicibacterium hippocampi]GFH04487.1 hypothetical protein MHIP_49700 [Mycolicibacterium hippocampi]
MAFEHYLSYGSTDQLTARTLTDFYDGLLVPGTVAAFQADGTKGFVLTLSAAHQKPYIIDPRFPLFQNRLSTPKKSHVSLATVLGDPSLVSEHSAPTADEFDDARCQVIARSWVEFNAGYTTVSSKHFAKYAKRLGREIAPTNSQVPRLILAPYVMSSGIDDGWWDVSERLYAHTIAAAQAIPTDIGVFRVVAAKSTAALEQLLTQPAASEPGVFIWVDNLHELESSVEDLVRYGRAIRGAKERGLGTWALYGGYFSVVMGQFGLAGSSHGIGYGESRQWKELPSSGPPPARFYLPRVHRYVATDLAEFLWNEAPELVNSAVYSGSPAALDYHDLMAHSVRCRQTEINDCDGLSPAVIAQRLRQTNREFSEALNTLSIPSALRRKAIDAHIHLPQWADAIDAIAR